MSTVPRNRLRSPIPSPAKPRAERRRLDPASRRQLRKDRLLALLILATLAAVMGFIIWLASLGEGTPSNMSDYWPMLP